MVLNPKSGRTPKSLLYWQDNSIKAGVYLNRSEIWSNIKGGLLGLKWVGNTTRQLTTPKESPRLVADCWYPPINSSLQISIFQIHQIFNISYFPQFNLSFEKNISFQKYPKITQKFTQNRLTAVNEMSWRVVWNATEILTEGRVKRRQNSLHVYPRLKSIVIRKFNL